ncbi:MAG: hypothetical protein ABIQ01_05985 [Pseudolysinimonas sp.]
MRATARLPHEVAEVRSGLVVELRREGRSPALVTLVTPFGNPAEDPREHPNGVHQQRFVAVEIDGQWSRRRQPEVRLLVTIADHPVPRCRRGEPDGVLRDGPIHAEPQRRRDVVLVGIEPGDGLEHAGAADDPVSPGRGIGKAGELDAALSIEDAPLDQPLESVLADRLQSPVPPRHPLQQRLVDERIQFPDRAAVRDRGGRRIGDGDARRVDRHGGQHVLLGLVEEIPAPVDQCAQGLMPRERGAWSGSEQGETVVEPGVELSDGQGPCPGGRQFEREGEAVEAFAHPSGSRLVFGCDGESASGEDTIREEMLGVAIGEWAESDEGLPRDPERLAACRQHTEARKGPEQIVRHGGGGLHDVLAVVEHEQGVTSGERGDDPVSRAACRGLTVGRAQVPAERAEERSPEFVGRDRSQLDQHGARGVPGDFYSDPGLACTTRSDDGGQAGPGERRGDGRQFIGAPDEAGPGCGDRRRRLSEPGAGDGPTEPDRHGAVVAERSLEPVVALPRRPGRATPEGKGFGCENDRLLGRRCAGGRDGILESHGIDVVARDLEAVSSRRRREDPDRKLRPQPGDQ